MVRRHSDTVASAFVRGNIPDADKVENHFYQTPPVGTEKLLDEEDFPGITWECACGAGMMSRVLIDRGMKVVSTDLVDRGYGKRMNFLTDTPRFKFDNIVTNPPFEHTLEFMQKALSYKPKKMAMIARLAFLEGKVRKEFFQTSGLTRVLVFSTRLNMPRESRREEFGSKGGMVAYAWYVWHRGYNGRPELSWI